MTNERIAPERASHEVSSADFSEKSSLKQFVGSLFGFDFFISYAWADGRDYAVELAERLEREVDGKSYSCFLDSDEYSKGDDWKEAGKEALQKTSILILVGSPRALQSDPVLREVGIYTERKNRIIPIEFVDSDGNGTLDATRNPSPLHKYIRPEILRIKEPLTYRSDAPNQLAGPSEDVVKQITGSFDLITQSDKRSRVFGAAALFFAVVALSAVAFWSSSEVNRKEAERQRVKVQDANAELTTTNETLERSLLNSFNDHRYVAGEARRQGKHDEMLLWYLRAYQTVPPKYLRLRESARRLIGSWAKTRGLACPHDGPIHALTFSPDSATLATASDDKTVRFWDSETGEPRHAALAHDGGVAALAFGPNGDWVLTGHDKPYSVPLTCWNVKEGTVLNADSTQFGIECLSVSSDGKSAIAFDGLWLNMFDPTTRKYFKQNEQRDVVAVCASNNCALRLSSDNTIELCKIHPDAALEVESLLVGHNDNVLSAAFSIDGSLAITGSADNTARVWDVSSGMLVAELSHHAPVTAVAVGPGNKRFVTGGTDGIAWLWEKQSFGARTVGQPMRHQGEVLSVTISNDERCIATGGSDGIARLWRASEICPILSTDIELDTAMFSPDGERVLVLHGSTLGTLPFEAKLFNCKSGKAIGNPFPRRPGVVGEGFSTDGKLVLTAKEPNVAQIWDARTAAPLGKPMLHDWDLKAVAISHNGCNVITLSKDGLVRIWDWRRGTTLGNPLRHKTAITEFKVNPAGESLIAISGDEWVRHWRFSGKLLKERKVGFRIGRLGLSPNGDHLFCGEFDGKGDVRNVRNLEPVVPQIDRFSEAFAFHSGNRLSMVVSNELRLLDLRSRGWCGVSIPMDRYMQLGDGTCPIAFTSDGTLCLTRTYARLRLSDRSDQQSSREFQVQGVREMGFGPNATWLAAVTEDDDYIEKYKGGGDSGDGRVWVWDLRTGDLLGEQLACDDWGRRLEISALGQILSIGSRRISLWPGPTLADDDESLLQLSVEVRTGLHFDADGTVKRLSTSEWLKRRERLGAAGGYRDYRAKSNESVSLRIGHSAPLNAAE